MTLKININIGKDPESSTVNAEGFLTELLPVAEQKTWSLNSNSARDLINNYSGRDPTSHYLGSPTPWDDLYIRYGWDPVQRHLKVKSAKILTLSVKPEVVGYKTFTNNSSVRASFNAGIERAVTDSIAVKNFSNHTLSIGRTISLGFNVGFSASAELSMNYSYNWGNEDLKSEAKTIGAKVGINVDLDPGQSVQSILTTNAGYALVRVEFEAYLTGKIATNYATPLNGHHFWAFDVKKVRESSGLQQVINLTQDIEINYFTDSSIELRDGDNKFLAMHKT